MICLASDDASWRHEELVNVPNQIEESFCAGADLFGAGPIFFRRDFPELAGARAKAEAVAAAATGAAL